MQSLTEFRPRARLFSLWTLAVLLTAAVVLAPWPGTPSAAVAQEEPPAAKEAPAAPSTEEAAPEQSILGYGLRALGFRYTIPFLFLSFASVALMVMNTMELRRERMCPEHLVATFEEHVRARRYQEAYDVAKADGSFLGQILAAGVSGMAGGPDRANKAMEDAGEEEHMKLEHRLGYMALIGTVSPMLGLFGTVDGMILAFMVIGRTNTTPKPSELADGVATALVTTYVGLAIAIPTITVLNILKNRMARMILEVAITSENVMRRCFEAAPTQK
jgi:biopolymer transport protein ExbB